MVRSSSIQEISLFTRLALAMLVAAYAFALSDSAKAQQPYPEKSIRLIVPYVAGGTPDFIVRAIEPAVSSQLGQRLVIDNRPGAGGLIGTDLAAKSSADGYTLVLGGTSNFCILPALQARNKRFNVMEDFSHIALLAQAQLLVVSHPSLPANSVNELIKLAKSHPGKLRYASSGNGTTPHMLGELFKNVTGLNVQHVPYKGGPQAWTAVVSGEVELLIGQVQQAIPHAQTGRVRPYAVFGAKRSNSLPKVPSFSEAGIQGLEIAIWYSIAAPAKTSTEIVNVLNNAINNALSSSEVDARLNKGGLDILRSTPEEAARFTQSEIPRWADAVRISGAKVD
ncbi:MAG: tripartite tricarboxylate transporter substrate binding protein [Burkholderiales bacterium]|nr:tripartite tricarboxylate transporter substrate binding protein [Burkholderiales bacterium]